MDLTKYIIEDYIKREFPKIIDINYKIKYLMRENIQELFVLDDLQERLHEINRELAILK